MGKGQKPKPPYKDFPLFPHASGQWCKKILGVPRYFGKWDDWQAALDKYTSERDDLYAGRTPQPKHDGVVVADIASAFRETKLMLLNSGELSNRTYIEYANTCDMLVGELGKNAAVGLISPGDFEKIRSKLAAKWGPVRLGNEIQRIRSVFKHAYDHGLIDKPMRFGQAFRRPSAKVLRKNRAAKGKKLFDAKQIVAILNKSGVYLKAMVLLGINCGFGNNDIATLPATAINLKTKWVHHPRPKTGIDRRCPLWPETIDAIKAAKNRRYKHKRPEHAKLVFVTKQGNPFSSDTTDSPISKEMRKVLSSLKICRKGVNFYSLRHTFETIAGESKDQVAVDYIMGHAPRGDDMASIYREDISDARLLAVSQHVRDWLFGAQSKSQSA